ncbi:hypothetical protein INT45_003850 [Circinella minor]|uniref:Uncharacterized protein n=1 Tax=Circinella minor TaxID=1195481 RepID=A0A8H7VNF6_9FUNG|nr:hypothetical protein INT45_003850 [Circinella minor]
MMQQNNNDAPSQPTTHVFRINTNNNNNSSLSKNKKVTGTQKRKKNSIEEGDLPPNKKSWDKDNATPNSKCSDEVLLEWLTEPGNFQQYMCARGKSGNNKVLASIVTRLHKHKLTHQTKDTVDCHIQEWIHKFNNAYDIVHRRTRECSPTVVEKRNVSNDDIYQNKSAQVKQAFKYYYELETIMCNTHSCNPLYLSESIHLSSPSTSQVQSLVPKTSTLTTMVDSALNALYVKDDDDFYNEETIANDNYNINSQTKQNLQSLSSVQSSSPKQQFFSSRNKIETDPIASVIYDMHQHNSKYFKEMLALRQEIARHKKSTDLELLSIKRRNILIKERESKTNLIQAMVTAGFSTDAIQKELLKDSIEEKNY